MPVSPKRMVTIFDREPRLAEIVENLKSIWPEKGPIDLPIAEVILENVRGMVEQGWGTNSMDSVETLPEEDQERFLDRVRPMLDGSNPPFEDFLLELQELFFNEKLAARPGKK